MVIVDTRFADLSSEKSDCIVIPLIDSKVTSSLQIRLNQALGAPIKLAMDASFFSGKDGEILTIPTFGKIEAGMIVLVGLGQKGKITSESIRKMAGEVAKKMAKVTHMTWFVDSIGKALPIERVIGAVVEGVVMGSYKFDQYKKSDREKILGPLHLSMSVPDKTMIVDASSAALIALRIAQAANTARDLANMPPNVLTPDRFVKMAKEFLKKTKAEIEVIDQKKAAHYGMGAFVGVAQGAIEPAYILILRHRPNKTDAPITLVGKGVTFDSGGISIKPGKGMSDMKADMSGGAAVLCAFHAAVDMNVPINLTAIIPLTENMPDGFAQRPGDIVTAMNGKTIEIINTDAEGRLILADALTYAVSEEKSKKIIDIATLTGACSVAIGDLAAGVLGNNQALINELIAVGETTGEILWQLPLFDGYLEYLKSDVADIANASEAGKAGTCTGAKFLEQFVGETPWAHLDIASVMKGSGKGYQPKGMSGAGTRLLIEWIMKQPSK